MTSTRSRQECTAGFGENFPYGFKGAQARRNTGRQLALGQRHAKLRWLGAAQFQPARAAG
jgi:hypothetical protein